MKHPIKQALLLIYCMIHIRLVKGCREQIVVLESGNSLKLKTVIGHLSHSVGQSEPGKTQIAQHLPE